MSALLDSLPKFSTKTVFHVGLEPCFPAPKQHARSLEGPCLSVSRHPDAWTKIARLGGYPWWKIVHAEGRRLTFVDRYKIREEMMAGIMAEAVKSELVAHKTLWRAWDTDEEGDWSYSVYGSEDEARVEVQDDEGPNGPSVEAFEGFEALPALVSWWSARSDEPQTPSFLNVEDAALLCLCDRDPQLDGVWFNENLDPWSYSAPRGAIFQRVVSALKVAEISSSES